MCHLKANFSLYHPGDCTGNIEAFFIVVATNFVFPKGILPLYPNIGHKISEGALIRSFKVFLRAKTADHEEAFDDLLYQLCSPVYKRKLLERNRLHRSVKYLSEEPLEIAFTMASALFLAFRIPKPERAPPPTTLSSLG